MSPSAIELDSVRKAYGDGTTATVALEGVNLAVAPGRFVSLIGPSGCGKSTLLRITAGRPDVLLMDEAATWFDDSSIDAIYKNGTLAWPAS